MCIDLGLSHVRHKNNAKQKSSIDERGKAGLKETLACTARNGCAAVVSVKLRKLLNDSNGGSYGQSMTNRDLLPFIEQQNRNTKQRKWLLLLFFR